MARKPEALAVRAGLRMGGPAAVARRGLAALKKAALRRPATPPRMVRRLAKPRPDPG